MPRGKKLTVEDIDMIDSLRLTTKISTIAKLLECSIITIRKQFNKMEVPYMNDKGVVKGGYSNKVSYVNPDQDYRPKNITKGHMKHINQPLEGNRKAFGW